VSDREDRREVLAYIRECEQKINHLSAELAEATRERDKAREQVQTEIGLADVHRRNLCDALGMTTHSIDMNSLIGIVRMERGLALARAEEGTTDGG
jgi:hypothetical protein